MDDKVGDEATFDEEFVSTEARMKEKRSMSMSMSMSMKQRGVIGGRKDRHSKVLTARGSRDRRVRLSPKTAILFYDVQDRLGCDRPSKAIDWLINEAKPAIDALLHHHPPTPPPPHSAPTNADHLPISAFGFLNGGPLPPELQGRSKAGDEEYNYDQQQFLSPLELFDANSEILRLQGILSWNYADADNFHYPAASADFYEREPLQSTYSTISNSPQFQGFGFPDQDLPNFKDDEINLRHPPS